MPNAIFSAFIFMTIVQDKKRKGKKRLFIIGKREKNILLKSKILIQIHAKKQM